jgi:hypothetical protein
VAITEHSGAPTWLTFPASLFGPTTGVKKKEQDKSSRVRNPSLAYFFTGISQLAAAGVVTTVSG